MSSLDTLTEQAINWHDKPLSKNEKEVSRIMTICNACRYCEGFCAVFPAMTRRLSVWAFTPNNRTQLIKNMVPFML